jgi:hypothetical protein
MLSSGEPGENGNCGAKVSLTGADAAVRRRKLKTKWSETLDRGQLPACAIRAAAKVGALYPQPTDFARKIVQSNKFSAVSSGKRKNPVNSK